MLSTFLNYRMPAEWEPHEATWLAWPHNIETWPGKIDAIEQLWAWMVAELSRGEKVHLNVLGPEMEKRAREILAGFSVNFHQVFFHHFPTDDAWVRDHGPIFLVRKEGRLKQLALCDWGYNAWGGKYPPFDRDAAVPKNIAEILQIPCFQPEMILEGGSIEVNGLGTLLTTESCLLNPNRNPQLTREDIKQRLKSFLNVQNILWLGEGIVGDDTDGHVDDMVRFVNAKTVVCVVEEDSSDENYAPLQENYERLQGMKDQDGMDLQVISLPMPKPVFKDGERLPASYANFYIGNEVVLVPLFMDEKDEIALKILKSCFPTRRVVGLDSRELIVGLGAFHCITQQQPAL